MAYYYSVQSVDRKDNILLLSLAPRKADHVFSFEPGQYATISLRQGLRPTPMRCFSIISSPASNVLQFAMRVEGNFTQAAARLRPGSTVKVQGPFGNFTINPDYDRRIVMLASGIGITPFLSMLRDLSERRIRPHVTLLYSNKSSISIPFKSQLQNLAQQNQNLQVDFFSGDTTGRITEQHLLEVVSANDKQTTYFICGTTNFTQRTQTTLAALGVDGSRILSETFTQAMPVNTDSGISLRTITYSLSAAVMVLVTAGIMLLDLSRNLPTHTKTAASKTPSVTTSPTVTNGTINNQSQTTTSTSTQSNTGSSSYTTYQTPVSSVS